MKTTFALLKKEFRIQRKSNILKLALTLSFVIELLLVMYLIKTDLSMSLETREENFKALSSFPVMFAFLGCYFMNIYTNPIKADIESGWHIYSYTLPVKPAERAKAVLFHRLVFSLTGIAISICVTLATSLFLEKKPDSTAIVAAFLITALLILINTSCDFFVLKARTNLDLKRYTAKGNASMVVSFVIVFFILLYACGVNITDLFKGIGKTRFVMPAFGYKSLCWAVPALGASVAVSYFVVKSRLASAYAEKAEPAKRSGIAALKKRDMDASYTTGLTNRKEGAPTGFVYMELANNKLAIASIILMPLFCSLIPFIVNMPEVIKGRMTIAKMFENANQPIILVGLYIMGFLGINVIISNTFGNDNKKLWAYFVAASPKGIKGYVYNKYVFFLGLNIAFHASCYFTNQLLSTVSYFAAGHEMPAVASVYLMGIYLMFFVTALDLPLVFRFGPKRASIIKTIGLILFFIALTVAFGIISEEARERVVELIMNIRNLTGRKREIFAWILGICPIITTVMYVFSWRVSTALYIRGAESRE